MTEPIWWGLTVVLPCIAIVAYWLIARRQVRVATRDLQEELDRERRIVAQVSHRLRNPLTVIYGFSETLVDPTILREADEVASVAAMVNAEALDVSRTVEDLVTAQEVDRGELQIRRVGFDPRDEIERVVTPFRRLGSSISVEAWSGTAISDPLRLRHVLQTLVSNAVRHGGSEISIFADLDGAWYRCTVADDGPGLPDDTADRLFGSFRGAAPPPVPETVTDDADRESPRPGPPPALVIDPGRVDGLGLGLSVAVRIATHLGGALTYEHDRDFTAFTLSLPTAAWPGPLVPLVPPPTPIPDDDDHDGGTDDAVQEQQPDGPTVSFDDARTEGAATEAIDDGAVRS